MASEKIRLILFVLLLPLLSTAKVEVKRVLAASNGACNGSIEVVMTGDKGPYTLNLQGVSNQEVSNVDDSYTFQNLCSGSYTLDVSGAGTGGCVSTFNIFIDDVSCSAIDIVLVKSSDATDCESEDGYVGFDIINQNKGVAFEYEVSNGQSSSSKGDQLSMAVNYLAKGDYAITVVDDNGCSSVFPFSTGPVNCETTCPTDFEVNLIDSRDVSCNNASDGFLEVNGNNGAGSYSFLWNTGDITARIDYKTAGDYEVTVTDANDCTASSTFTIGTLAEPSVTAQITNTSCGQDNGAINITVSGHPSFSYIYSWTHIESGTTYSDEDLVNIPNGNYELLLSYGDKCEVFKNYTIGGSTGNLSVSASRTKTPWCSNAPFSPSTGEITVNASGGVPPFDYVVTNNYSIERTVSGTNDRSVAFDDLPVTDYDIIVTDASNCTSTTTFTLEGRYSFAVTGTVTDAKCNESNGAIDLEIENGASPYNYDWAHIPGDDNVDDLSGLAPGFYEVTVTDAAGSNCERIKSFEVLNEVSLVIDYNVIGADCSDNGQIQVNVLEGTPPYTYAWRSAGSSDAWQENGPTASTSYTIMDLPLGDYEIRVSDDSNCSYIENHTINRDESLLKITSVESTGTECAVETGTVTVSLSDGTAPFTYILRDSEGNEESITSNQRTATFTNLGIDNYEVEVTDQPSCVRTSNISVIDDSEFYIELASSNPQCGGANGELQINFFSGASPYDIDWAHLPDAEDDVSMLTDLNPDDYEVTVTDANGCVRSASSTLVNVDDLAANFSYSDTDCLGNGGSLSINLTGGDPLYTYYWRASTESVWNEFGPTDDPNFTVEVAIGSYRTKVTNEDGCEIIGPVVNVRNGDDPSFSISLFKTDASCGQNNGQIELQINEGTSPHTIDWAHLPSSQDNTTYVSDLGEGTYTVTVTDANHCERTASTTIIDSGELNGGFGTNNANCNGTGGSIAMSVLNGTPPYKYQWREQLAFDWTEVTIHSSSYTTPPLGAGNYFAKIEDSSGCEDFSSLLTISSDSRPSISYNNVNHNCSGGGTISISVNNGLSPFEYEWTRDGSGVVSRQMNLSANSGGLYRVTVIDRKGCRTPAPNGKTLYNQLGVMPKCDWRPNLNDFDLRANKTGGAGPNNIDYIWSGPESLGDQGNHTPTTPGTYSVTVEDRLTGCQVSGSTTCSNNNSASQINDTESTSSNEPIVNIYPNPFDNLLHIDINSQQEQTLEIEILDLIGRIIYRRSLDTEVGLNKLSVDMESTSAASGLYQVLIRGKDTVPQNFKVVRMRQ